MAHSSSTVQLVSITLGPIWQFLPTTVSPRKMVPGRSWVPSPTWTESSTYTEEGSIISTPASSRAWRLASKAA